MKYFKQMGLMLAVMSTGAVAQAQNLSTYSTTCKDKLGLTQIPGYTCSFGTAIASGQNLGIQTINNRLGKVPTTNPNVDAVFLCRDYKSASNTSYLNGYILQNTVTGDTCFFDALEDGNATVPSPNAGNATSFWRQPSQMAGSCPTCHSGDPFIATPGLAPAFKAQGLMKNSRNLLGAYNVVDNATAGSHFFNWNALRQLTTPCGTCHNLGSSLGSTEIRTLTEPFMTNPMYSIPAEPASSQIGVWRPGATGYFYLDKDGNRSWSAPDLTGAFGTTGDKPVVLRGTNCSIGPNFAEIGVVRAPSTWLVSKNNHYWDSAVDSANTFTFGTNGKPRSWNGVAVSFESATFWVDLNHNKAYGAGDVTFGYGYSTDYPLIGRWKRGISHRIAVTRPIGNEMWWYLDANGSNAWDSGDSSVQFGSNGDTPVAGDFNADGVDEIGVFKNGIWYIDMNNNFVWNGPNGGDAQWTFGQAGDVPVVSPTKWTCSP